MTDEQRKMILDWMRKIHQLEYAHRFESLKWSRRNKILGISAFIISIIITFSYRFREFGLRSNDDTPFYLDLNFYVAILAFTVAVITGYQTFTKPNEKSQVHKNTGSNYEKLRHRIELILTMNYPQWEFQKRTEAIKEEWESLDAINVSPKYFTQGKEKVKSFNKYYKELDFLPDVSP